MHYHILFFAATFAPLLTSVWAKNVVITVGGNSPATVFEPQTVNANSGDVVIFNFTQGNHTATQSTFALPCIPEHITNSTYNGFDSSFRNTDNGTAITTLDVPITDDSQPIWFFDWNTCSQGGVGGINVNESSTENIDGLQRNAMRLNGTHSSSSSASPTATATSIKASQSATPSKSSAAKSSITSVVFCLLPTFILTLITNLN